MIVILSTAGYRGSSLACVQASRARESPLLAADRQTARRMTSGRTMYPSAPSGVAVIGVRTRDHSDRLRSAPGSGTGLAQFRSDHLPFSFRHHNVCNEVLVTLLHSAIRDYAGASELPCDLLVGPRPPIWHSIPTSKFLSTIGTRRACSRALRRSNLGRVGRRLHSGVRGDACYDISEVVSLGHRSWRHSLEIVVLGQDMAASLARAYHAN